MDTENRIARLEEAIIVINKELGGILANITWIKWFVMAIAGGIITLLFKAFA